MASTFTSCFARQLPLEQGFTSNKKQTFKHVFFMKKTIVVLMVAALSVTGLFASPAPEGQDELVPQTCNIRIAGTYDSKEINITVSIEAENCAKAAGELLKAALAKK